MDQLELIRELARENSARIVFLIMDGLGGIPVTGQSKSELELAHRPNLDRLAKEGVTGLLDPIAPGITPGSGPAHLALFGYDPVRYNVGRGVLEALGIDFPLEHGDVAIRINFCTVDQSGVVTDRRAGRISSDQCKVLAEELDRIQVPGVKLFVRPVKEHRAAMVLRGPGLGSALNDTDPQLEGKKPRELQAGDELSKKTVEVTNRFLDQAKQVLAKHHPANMLLLRGFAAFSRYPSFAELYKVKAAAIAQYPMYKGLARMLGMEILPVGDKLPNLMDVLEAQFQNFTFFYVHVKKTDSSGEDGDWARKMEVIEAVDGLIPRIAALKPEVIVVTGDHSTPAALKGHSWHPLPALIWSQTARPDEVAEFTERACARGGLGRLPSTSLMPLALAHALKLEKFGA